MNLNLNVLSLRMRSKYSVVYNQHGTGVRRGGVLLGLRGPDPQAQDSSYRRREAAAKERLAPQDGPSLGMRIWENRNCQNVAQTWIRGEV